jgi:hypothetical protein
MIEWIKLPKGVYEKGVEAALREQDRVGLSVGALNQYQAASEPLKRDMERIWKTGFSALIRAAFKVKNYTWTNLPDGVYEEAIRACFTEQGKLWVTADLFTTGYVNAPKEAKQKMLQVQKEGFRHLVRAWI